MSYETLFVITLFVTRIVLPVVITLVLGELVARRFNRQETVKS